MKENVLKIKSYNFAISIVEICRNLNNEKKEFILSKQLLRSGTSIGALIRESEFAESKADFISKLSISLKESNETEYWISLLYDTGYIDKVVYDDLANKVQELIRILVKSLNTVKSQK